MRKRSNTTNTKAEPKQDDIRREFQTLKMDHSILQQKFSDLKSERDVLKDGNSNLISQFLFDKHRDELTKMSDALKEKNQEITELKKIIEQIDRIIKGVTTSTGINSHLKEKQMTKNFEHSTKFSIKMTDQNLFPSFWGKKPQINPKQVKENVVKLKQSYDKQLILNKQLEQQNVQLGQQIQFLRANLEQISNDLQKSVPDELLTNNEELMQKVQDISQELISLKKQNSHLDTLLKRNQEQFIFKEKQLVNQNKQLSEKIKQLDREVKLRKSSLENNDTKISSLGFRQTRLIDSEINMSVSICNSDDMKKSLIYQNLSESCMQESVVTESYDKKLTKLQKTNASLQKDNKNSQQKIKSINREYSKLKLDYLKLTEQWKLREDDFENRILILNDKLQTAGKKSKEHQNAISSLKVENQRQKSTLKGIIMDFESKQAESQNLIEKYKQQIQNFKEELENTKKLHQMSIMNNSELQNQKSKNKILQKTIQQYETILQDVRKVTATQKEDSKQKRFSRKDIKSSEKKLGSSHSLSYPFKKNGQSPSEIHIHIQSDSILKTLKNQVETLETNLKLQNERYNILENSNRELRKQLLKMIDQEEKLRKDLINEKIKAKTKSVSSKNGKSFLSRRLKEDFSEEKNQMKSNHCESNLNLPIGSNLKTLNRQRSTERNFDSVQMKRGLYPSNSNSQIVIITDRNYGNEEKRIENNFERKGQVSYLKAMRERRFDPQETSNAVSVKQSHLTERVPPLNQRSRENSVEFKKGEISRFSDNIDQKSPLKSRQMSNPVQSLPFFSDISPVPNKSFKEGYKAETPSGKKNLNQINSAKTKESLNAQAKNQKEQRQIKQETTYEVRNEESTRNLVNEAKKYVYQPPKKYIPGLRMVTSITNQNQKEVSPKKVQNIILHEEKDEELISLSNDNRQITLEISSSKSNKSKADMVLESMRIESIYEERNRSTRSIKEPQSDRKAESPESIEVSQFQEGKTNMVLSSKVHATKSNAEPRFMRKH